MNLAIEYAVEDCIHCGFQFALPDTFICRRKQDHKSFYCPSCRGSMHWPQLSDEERLRRQLENVQSCCVEYEQKAANLEKSRRALKGHVTRLKKKVA